MCVEVVDVGRDGSETSIVCTLCWFKLFKKCISLGPMKQKSGWYWPCRTDGEMSVRVNREKPSDSAVLMPGEDSNESYTAMRFCERFVRLTRQSQAQNPHWRKYTPCRCACALV